MKKILATVLGIAIVFLFFSKNLLTPAVNITPSVGTNDLTDLNYPFRYFLSESLKQNTIPVWSSSISAGFPIAAEGQIGALYPLNLLFAGFPTMVSINLTIVLSYLLTFLFSYLYLRKIGAKFEGAVFAAIVISFGGFAINELLHFGMLTSFYLFLAQLYFLERYLRENNLVWVILMGVSLGFSFLGGHPQIIFYSMFFLLPYWVYFYFFVENTTSNKNKFLKKFIGFILPLLIFVVLGFGIGAGQILPQAEFTLHSTRAGGLTSEAISKFSMRFIDLMSFISPFHIYDESPTYQAFLANGWPIDERYVYIGILGIVFAVFGLIRAFKNDNNKPYAKIFLISLLLSFLLSLGTNITFGQFFTLPPFNFFRLPLRMIFLTGLSLGVLSSFAFDDFFEWMSKKKVKTVVKYLIFVGIISLSALDLYINSQKLHPLADAKNWYKTPQVVDYLKENLSGQERVTVQQYFYPAIKLFLQKNELWGKEQTYVNLRNLIPVFNNLLYNIPENVGAANSAGLKVERFNDLESYIFFNGVGYTNQESIEVSDSWLFLNRIMGVRYFVSAFPTQNSLLIPVKEVKFENGQDPVYIYEFSDYYPRAFMAPISEKLEPQEIFNHLMKGDFYLKDKVFLEEDTDWGTRGGFSSATEINEYTDTLVRISTQGAGDGFLFLSDTYYPGWKAYVDGVEKKIYRANYAFRAVEVPAGQHEVVFKYEPESLYWGVRVSLGTFVFAVVSLLGIGVISLRKQRRKTNR